MSPPLPSQQTRGVFLFACLCFLPLIYSYWFVCDDAFISFRYAKHFALGEGLRYNLGTQVPVEGYSNLLWVILCAVFERLHLSVEFFAPLLSSTCALLLLYRLCTHLVFVLKAPPLLSLFGVLSFALFPPAGLWATGGLATAPFALLVFLCYEALFTWSSLRYATFFGVLLVLLRAEGVVVALGLGILSLAFRPLPVRRQNVFFLSSIVVATLLLTAWRWSYYGEFLPNTVLVKGEVSLLRLERGWKYVAVFCLTFLSSLLALVLSLYYLLRPSDKLFLPACCFLAFVAYAILSGGDFMPMGRFLAPAFAFQAILLTVTLKRALTCATPLKLSAITLFIGLLITSLLPAWNINLVPEQIRSKLHFRENTTTYRSETEQWQIMKQRAENWKEKGLALKAVTRPGESLVTKAIGNVGYFSDLTIYDQFGLVSKEVARLPQSTTPRSPGHDKEAPFEFFLDKEPTYLDAKLLTGKNIRGAAKRAAKEWRSHSAITSLYAPELYSLTSRSSPSALLLLKKLPPETIPDKAWSEFSHP